MADSQESPVRIEIKNLGLCRERWIFRNQDLRIPCGQFLAISGPSGIGKTSFLRLLSGLEEATEGSVSYVDSQGLRHAPRNVRRDVGVVFQNFRLIPNRSLLENVLCGRLGRYAWWQTALGFPAADAAEAKQLLEEFGLGDRLGAWASKVSGGEQQRTALARALFQEPSVLLADEPVSQLDADLAHFVLDRLKAHSRLKNTTVLCVLHDAKLVARYADAVFALENRDP